MPITAHSYMIEKTVTVDKKFLIKVGSARLMPTAEFSIKTLILLFGSEEIGLYLSLFSFSFFFFSFFLSSFHLKMLQHLTKFEHAAYLT